MVDSAPLAGQCVAFTGRLVSLTKSEAAQLVEQCGGEWSRSVTRLTTQLVIGQEGWPLKQDGRLTRKLQRARQLNRQGNSIAVVTEEHWLRRLELKPQLEHVCRLFSLAELHQFLDVPRNRLRSWIRAGLLKPIQQVKGVAYFDLRQASGVRSLAELARRGVTVAQLKQSFHELRQWMAEADNPLALLEHDGRLLVRLHDDLLADPAGQLCWDFSDDSCVSVTFDPGKPSQQDLFEAGWAFESTGKWDDAVQAYRQALLAGKPIAQLCMNLANVLYTTGRLDAAIERYWQAIELEPAWAEAWNNLGVALADRSDHDQAIAAYERSIQLNPNYNDPHYNLADLFTRLRKSELAIPLWRRYLELDSSSIWADYARKQLKGTSGTSR